MPLCGIYAYFILEYVVEVDVEVCVFFALRIVDNNNRRLVPSNPQAQAIRIAPNACGNIFGLVESASDIKKRHQDRREALS